MCNLAEQSGVDQASDSRKDNGFTSESDILFICATTTEGNGNIRENFKDISKKVCNSGQNSLVNDSCCHKVFRTLPQTSEQFCTIRFADLKNDRTTTSMENGMMNTLPTDKEFISKSECLETEILANDRLKFKMEDVQETREEVLPDLIESSEISDGTSGQTPFEVAKVPALFLVPGGQELAAEAAVEAATDMYRGAKVSEMQASMQHSDDTEIDFSSVAGSVGKSECRSTDRGTDEGQKISTLKYDALSLQEVNNSNEKLPEGPREYVTCIDERHSTTNEMADDRAAATTHIEKIRQSMPISNTSEHTDNHSVTCIAAGFQVETEQIESNTAHGGQAVNEIAVIEFEGKLTPDMASVSEELTLEHGQKGLNKACQDSAIEVEQQDTNVLSIPQIVHPSNTKGNNGPELAEFFSNARGSKYDAEIEEQDHIPIKIKSPPKSKSYMESPRSLRMLLFSDEPTSLSKKDEKYKRDGKGMEFSSKVVPAFEGIGDERHNEDINFPKWHEVADNMEASTGFSGPIAFSGSLTFQGLMSYTGPVAYSGSISHRSDSSTSTRSFAFPILASEWNTSPVKMDAPDPRFFRQRRKWHLCSCCKRPSTLFD